MAAVPAAAGVKNPNQRPKVRTKSVLGKGTSHCLPVPQVVELESSLVHFTFEGKGK